ncbi:hypothetical protein [Leptolyngbya sp. 7M]|uniref:hypothetical protein n=1 Tax=Leptolyngbya sp. 7M TaxID=2812896 RepID=UPI001B8C3DFD|nr:hypothetical protein [Leptolyngbya sp. 7M]QYO63999.1 hypothetical protein JVX88_30080 [Leptolyngbya sp. 7M]
MFLVRDSSSSREERIERFLEEDPALAALLAVIHFEWTVRRAIIALGTSPNVVIRETMEKCHGLSRYKQVWQEEVFPNVQRRLPEVVRNWDGLDRAFRLRHRLVHGVTSCDPEYAKARVRWAIDATNDLRVFCGNNGIDLDSRLPVRRAAKS